MKCAIKAITFLAVFIILFSEVQNLLMLKDNAYKTKSFYELEKDTCDVVFLGSSTMLAVQPMELYGKYGITSYNLAQHGQSFALTYYSLIDAIWYQHPKVVVVDVHTIYRQDKDFKNEYAHYTLDNMPLGVNKVRAILDVIKPEERLEFFFPIVKYHSRWSELKESDFVKQYDYWRGTYFRGGWTQFTEDGIHVVEENEVQELDALGKEYITKIIELCKEKEVELILTNMPICANADGWDVVQKKYNYVKQIAEENDIAYLNFMYVDAGIDIANDFCDYEHLNIYGGLKITEYLSNYLYENYELRDHRKDMNMEQWNIDYNAYVEARDKFLTNFSARYKK